MNGMMFSLIDVAQAGRGIAGTNRKFGIDAVYGVISGA